MKTVDINQEVETRTLQKLNTQSGLIARRNHNVVKQT
jgi:hypothetical protein